MPVLDTYMFVEDPIENESAIMEILFSHYKSMGAFVCHDNQYIN